MLFYLRKQFLLSGNICVSVCKLNQKILQILNYENIGCQQLRILLKSLVEKVSPHCTSPSRFRSGNVFSSATGQFYVTNPKRGCRNPWINPALPGKRVSLRHRSRTALSPFRHYVFINMQNPFNVGNRWNSLAASVIKILFAGGPLPPPTSGGRFSEDLLQPLVIWSPPLRRVEKSDGCKISIFVLSLQIFFSKNKIINTSKLQHIGTFGWKTNEYNLNLNQWKSVGFSENSLNFSLYSTFDFFQWCYIQI